MWKLKISKIDEIELKKKEENQNCTHGWYVLIND